MYCHYWKSEDVFAYSDERVKQFAPHPVDIILDSFDEFIAKRVKSRVEN